MLTTGSNYSSCLCWHLSVLQRELAKEIVVFDLCSLPLVDGDVNVILIKRVLYAQGPCCKLFSPSDRDLSRRSYQDKKR